MSRLVLYLQLPFLLRYLLSRHRKARVRLLPPNLLLLKLPRHLKLRLSFQLHPLHHQNSPHPPFILNQYPQQLNPPTIRSKSHKFSVPQTWLSLPRLRHLLLLLLFPKLLPQHQYRETMVFQLRRSVNRQM